MTRARTNCSFDHESASGDVMILSRGAIKVAHPIVQATSLGNERGGYLAQRIPYLVIDSVPVLVVLRVWGGEYMLGRVEGVCGCRGWVGLTEQW